MVKQDFCYKKIYGLQSLCLIKNCLYNLVFIGEKNRLNGEII